MTKRETAYHFQKKTIPPITAMNRIQRKTLTFADLKEIKDKFDKMDIPKMDYSNLNDLHDFIKYLPTTTESFNGIRFDSSIIDEPSMWQTATPQETRRAILFRANLQFKIHPHTPFYGK